MKYFFSVLCLILFRLPGIVAQEKENRIYDPGANAERDLKNAVAEARSQHKQVFVMAGGNWCGWCIEFEKFVHEQPVIDSILHADFVVYHLNFSKENENRKIFADFQYPQRFGFPVMLILDSNGTLIHTQNSEYLEQGRSYNLRKVKEFLLSWNQSALNPTSYQNH